MSLTLSTPVRLAAIVNKQSRLMEGKGTNTGRPITCVHRHSHCPRRTDSCPAYRCSHRYRSSKRLAGLVTTRASVAKAGDVEMEAEAEADRAVAVLKQAANTGAVPAALVCQALVQLEKKKLADDSYNEAVGGGPEGKRWKLIFNSTPKDVQRAQKGNKGGGFYFPIPAVQAYKKEGSELKNGIYLGQLAAFVFQGPYEYKKNKLSFDFDKLRVRLGPKWFDFNLKSFKKGKSGPFFLMVYADKDIIAARGRGGGIGLWQRTTPEWELKTGMTL